MAKESASTVTPEFRVSFPQVFRAKRNDLNGQDEFSVMALFKKGENLDLLKKAARAACVKKWGEDQTKWPEKIKSPFRDQKEKAKSGKLPEGHSEGAIFMTFKSKERPKVVDQNVQEIIESSQFYAGCWARASVSAFAYDQKGNKGISFGLNHLQFMRDGDAFSARPKVEDAFQPVDMGDSAEVGNGASSTDLF